MDPAAAEHREQVRSLLRAHGITPTSQRVRVAELLFARDQHLTADQILSQLRENGSRVSKATVYNTLNLFSAKKMLRHLNVEASHSSFDSNTSPHFHFHVENTGELIDVPPGDIEISRLPEVPEGMQLAGIEVIIRLRRLD